MFPTHLFLLRLIFLNFANLQTNTQIMSRILGLGNALVDILIPIPDETILQEAVLPKGSMKHVERKVIDYLLDKASSYKKQIASGGSAANAIHGLARLGNHTAFIGKTGRDTLGQVFYNDMITSGIDPLLIGSESDTGTALAFITPDSERTFAVYLGAALELSAEDLNQDQFNGYDLLHIEGYLVQNHELIETAVNMAQSAGLKISLDLASFNVVDDNLAFLQGIASTFVDILFANEDEARAFTGLDPEDAVSIMARHCDIAVVKLGAKGSLVKSANLLHKIEILPSKVIDTTGAGDLYAAGFLHGYLRGLALDKCGKIGALLSGQVIRHLGAKIPEETWPGILREVNSC